MGQLEEANSVPQNSLRLESGAGTRREHYTGDVRKVLTSNWEESGDHSVTWRLEPGFLLRLEAGPILSKCLPHSLSANILPYKIGVIIATASKVWVGISDDVSKMANTNQGLNTRYPCWD